MFYDGEMETYELRRRNPPTLVILLSQLNLWALKRKISFITRLYYKTSPASNFWLTIKQELSVSGFHLFIITDKMSPAVCLTSNFNAKYLVIYYPPHNTCADSYSLQLYYNTHTLYLLFRNIFKKRIPLKSTINNPKRRAKYRHYLIFLLK